MNTFLSLILPILAILLFTSIIASRPRGRKLKAFSNVGEGFQPNKKTYLSDAAITGRNLLMKIGSDAAHAALCGVADVPLGFGTDETPAAEELFTVNLLGVQERCAIGIASAAIAAGDFVVAAANGQLRTLPATTGSYYIVGRAIKAAANALDQVELVPCFPILRVVP